MGFLALAERGLPVTRVISRMALQEILARAVGEDSIMNESNVVDFVDHGDKVTVELENGQKYDGDLLVGADGIWSKVRNKLFGEREATYSGYTCYTGVADFVPADIESVGYRVFLGHKQYFVSSDVGAGKTQWYAFHQESAGGSDIPNGKKKRLLKMFEGWCDNVIDVLVATEEEAILRRDIYDRTPTFTWGKGRVTLLGDSIHAMQPNMGQGGCMAIEDSYQLALELGNAWEQSIKSGSPIDIDSSLKSYERERRLRVAIVHGMARMAALMASTYRAYLGVGLGPFEFLTKFRIPHPGRVGGRFLIDKMMPLMLNWVLGGNSQRQKSNAKSCLFSAASPAIFAWIMRLKSAKAIWNALKDYEGNDKFRAMQLLNLIKDFEMQRAKELGTIRSTLRDFKASLTSSKLEGRPICCRLSDKANDQLQTWFEDNDALERAINGEWILLPCDEAGSIKPISLSQDEMKPCIIGSSQHEDHPGSSIIIPLPKVSPLHARINYKDGAFFLTDLRSLHGTWITDNEGRRYRIHSNYPSRVRPSDVIEFGSDKASFRVKVTRSAPRESEKKGTKLYQKE
ncbi:zeaxanthin epoxidase, chloroplastic isoform X3 [Vigna angularis]|uniref:zeaxanthin epoxidase, chloroplastic isoform X3 n=1 Tax=Phaseolus angularis TaxID=3914 RepID=UPI0022B3500D|nr:zeaxanthin epoxidase, chloroplastic isoform X3 [Vigna angularis]